MISIKKLSLTLLFILPMPLFYMVGSAHADRRYVSDRLIVTLREGQDMGSRVIRTLKTDTPVDVLEEEGQFLRVRTDDGKEGWVPKQYVSSKTPKSEIIAGLEMEATRLKERVEELEKDNAPQWDELEAAKRSHAEKVKEFENRTKAIREEASRKTMELKQMSEKYNAFLTESKDMVKVINERDRLKGENVKLSTEVNQLQEETKHLLLTGMLRWFLAGGGVFLAGLIAGKFSRKKKYY